MRFYSCNRAPEVFVFDNKALAGICEKTLQIEVPKMQNLNNIIALCMSGMTSAGPVAGTAEQGAEETETVPPCSRSL